MVVFLRLVNAGDAFHSGFPLSAFSRHTLQLNQIVLMRRAKSVARLLDKATQGFAFS